jgi:hypothetical protein
MAVADYRLLNESKQKFLFLLADFIPRDQAQYKTIVHPETTAAV